jgi:sulfite exporter TauE/SafE
MTCWTAFILGLFSSLHCAGMCGPLAIALPHVSGAPVGFAAGRMAYNVGRILTYSLLGLASGVAGKTVLLAGFERGLSISLGLALLAGLLISRKLVVSSSKAVAHLKGRMAALLRRRSIGALCLLGLLNGLLPCGLVYVACAGAASTGSVPGATRYMAAFGFGTLPMMLAISLSGRLIPFSLRLKLAKAIPVSVLVLATLLILRGLSIGIPYISPGMSGVASCCCK